MQAKKGRKDTILPEVTNLQLTAYVASEKRKKRAGVWVDAGGARGGGRGVVLSFMLHIWLGFACAMRPVSTGKESGRTVFYRCRL